jgi:hypothetical protein
MTNIYTSFYTQPTIYHAVHHLYISLRTGTLYMYVHRQYVRAQLSQHQEFLVYPRVIPAGLGRTDDHAQ